jgi:hypothetical protein
MAEEFDVDISPRDLIAWIRADQAKRAPTLWASASKTIEKRDIDLETARVTLDDDVAETVTRGVLEVSPRRGLGGWVLRVTADDTAGEHPIGDEEAEEEAEELTLEAFEQEFLLPDGRIVDITVSVEDGEAKARLGRWVRRMQARTHEQPQESPVHRPATQAT